MKFYEIVNYLDKLYPKSLSANFDCDGIEVCADYNTEIGGVLLVLDITQSAINYAAENAFNLIIAHHPMIFSPIKKLDCGLNANAKSAVNMARLNICAASYHTRLDCVAVNMELAKACGLINNEIKITKVLDDEEKPSAILCELNENINEDGYNLKKFAFDLKNNIKEYYKRVLNFDFNNNNYYLNYYEINNENKFSNIKKSRKIKKIGICAGSGMHLLEACAKEGADLFITGEAKYHAILEAQENYNINIITAGHYETEALVLPEVKRVILKEFENIRVDYFLENRGGFI